MILTNEIGRSFEVLTYDVNVCAKGPIVYEFQCTPLDKKNELVKSPFEIKKVHFNDPATIVLWADGTKTVVKCGEEDIYDPQTGLLMCMAKKMYGNTGKFNDILREWIPEPEEEVEVDPLEAFVDFLHGRLAKEARG